jgi:predicted AlkP superfamily phosphohydrolase/phosphomutase
MTGVWVNLKGREPQGIVNPGDEYEAVRDEIINRLGYMQDPQKELPIVTKIFRREDIYHGPYVERAPDIVFKTRDEQYVGFGIQEFVSNKIAEPSPIFSACHRQAGMVVLNGIPFKQGHRLDDNDIVDLAPTILYLLGYSIPKDMDGRLIEESLESGHFDDHPVQFTDPSWVPSADEDAGFTSEEQEAVTEHLRSLGYL